MYSKPGIQRTMLPKLMKHVKSALEHKHRRNVAAEHGAMAGVLACPKRFHSIMGSGIQTEVKHANGTTLVRTYDDGESEVLEQEKVR